MYIINSKSDTPLHIQLFEALKADIIQNYNVNEKLPSIRKIANTYNLSKNTVESAYSQLVVEGYIESFPQRGYFVVDIKEQNFQNHQNLNEEEIIEKDYLYDFFPARLHKESFPLKLWKRIYNKTITENINFGSYPNKQGEIGLRKAVTNYLNHSRAVKCSAEQIILCNGFADAMGLLAMLLQDTHNSIAVESPGYHVVQKVFKNHRYTIEDIPLTTQGIDISTLNTLKSKLLYVTPSHQYPTGVSIPIANRMQLLQWADSTKSYIIEDDYDSELTYVNRPIPSLQGLDNNERVIYTGTFSKALSPAIRVTYLVLPKHLLNPYHKNFAYHASRVCLMTQYTLETFINDGYWDKHIRKMRTLNKKKHNLMKQLLEEYLGHSMTIESQGGGLAILINPNKTFDWKKLEILAEKEKIKLYYAKERTENKYQALMMGFGGFTLEEIEKAVIAFSKIWFKSIID